MPKFFTRILIVLIAVLCCGFCLGTTVSAATDDYVYLGGIPLGISMNTDGLIISGKSDVITDSGIISPAKDIDVRAGDILAEINGRKVANISELRDIVKKLKGEVSLTVLRGSEILNFKYKPAIESLNKEPKLGLLLRDNVSGIGTLTYITPRGRFAALGHTIYDAEIKSQSIQTGTIHSSNILDVKRGYKGKPGELQGIFNPKEKILGRVEKNNNFGIFGTYTSKCEGKPVKIGGIKTVKLGRAQIYSTIAGCEPRYYDIEIIRVNNQDNPQEKGMVIKVTDASLLSVTGGIVQGMSGSPVIQNGAIVGALTHVFINDPTQGYGVFIDWMLIN